MEAKEFIEQLKELAQQEDVLSVSGAVNDLRTKYEDYILEEERKAQVAQLEARDRGEEIPEANIDFGKDEFYAIYSEYKERRKAASEAIKAEELNNLQEKVALTKRLEDVIQNEENIGAAFAAFKEIQEKWKEIGDIPRNKRNEVQSNYSKLIEDFFYNISIYKQLKDHDFHRNLQLKEGVISKLKELNKVESIKEVEQQLKTLQNDWEDIGPVPNEEWERIKDAYWTEIRSIYERINRFYDDRRAAQQENLEKKKGLLDKVKEIISETEGLDSVKGWEAKTKQLLTIQEDWKKIGFGPRKENEAIWKELRSLSDEFFDKKRAFFDVIHKGFDAIAEKKMKLIEKAEAMKESTDWGKTSKELINLQKQWKQLGHSGRKNEQRLWKKFRNACDAFFNARQAHFAEQDKAFETNLKEKEAIIEEIKKYKAEGDKKEILAKLKSFAQSFNAIGMVPRKDKDKVYKEFKSALDKHYEALDLDAKEREQTLFSAKLETLKASPNASKKLGELKYQLRKDIDKLKKEINLLENNLGFFANSKGANTLKQDVEKKIAKVNKEIEKIKQRLKLIPNE